MCQLGVGRIQSSDNNNSLLHTMTQQLGVNNGGPCLLPYEDPTILGLITKTQQLWASPLTSP